MTTKTIAVPLVALAIETVIIGGIIVVLRTFCNSQDNGVLLTLGLAWASSAGLAALASRESFKKNETVLHMLYILGGLALVGMTFNKYYYSKYCNVNGGGVNKKPLYGDAQSDAAAQQALAKQVAHQTWAAQGKMYTQLAGESGGQGQGDQGKWDEDGAKSSASSGNSTNNSSLWYGVCFCLLALHFYFGLLMGIEKVMAMAGQ
jgi:hypothetical protein